MSSNGPPRHPHPPCLLSDDDDRMDSEASSNAANLIAANSSDNETLDVVASSSRPGVAFVSRPTIDNATERRKIRLQLAEDEDGRGGGRGGRHGGRITARSTGECCVSSNTEACSRSVAAVVNRPAIDNTVERRKIRSQLAEDESGRRNGRNAGNNSPDHNNSSSRPQLPLQEIVACELGQQQQQQRQQEPHTATTLKDDADGDFDEKIISAMMVQPTLESLPTLERMGIAFLQSSLFPLVAGQQSTTNVEEKKDDDDVMDDVEKGIVVADIRVEENVNHEATNDHNNPADASIGESTTVEGQHEALPMPAHVQSASIRSSDTIRSTPGAFSIQGINPVNEEEVFNEGDEYMDYAGMGIGRTAMESVNGFDEHGGIMVEANVVDVAAEEAERAETMNLRKETTSLRCQLEQLQNENMLLRDVETKRLGISFMGCGKIAVMGCPFLLLMILLIPILNNRFESTSNNYNVINETHSPIAITSENPTAVPSLQPSFAIRSRVQQSIRPSVQKSIQPSVQQSIRPSTSPSVLPPIVPVEWESIGGDVFGNIPGDWFGYQVDISGNGNRIAVRTYDNTFHHVRVYELAAAANTTGTAESTWQQMGDDITDATEVVMDETGDTIAVGDHTSDTVTTYIWDVSINEWKQFGTVLSGHGSPTVISLSSDGRQLAIGDAHSEEYPTGRVVVYKWNHSADDWIPMGDAIVGDNSFTEFGTSISLSGNGSRMTVGASLVDTNQFAVGRIQVFEWDEQMSAWKQHGQIITGYELYGHDFEMSRDGTTIIVGASLSSQGGAYSGRAVVYRYDGRSNRWTQLGDEFTSEVEDDRLGSSVSISKNGNRIAIGAYSSENVGHVRVFDWNKSNWIQSGNDVTGDEIDGHFGWSLSLSNDGTRMVVGAKWHECPDDNNDWISSRCGMVRTFDAMPLHPVS